MKSIHTGPSKQASTGPKDDNILLLFLVPNGEAIIQCPRIARLRSHRRVISLHTHKYIYRDILNKIHMRVLLYTGQKDDTNVCMYVCGT